MSGLYLLVRWVGIGGVVVLSSCALENGARENWALDHALGHDPQDRDPVDDPESRPYPPQFSTPAVDRFHADLFLVPAAWVQLDVEGETALDPDLDTGYGFGLRATKQHRDLGVGLLYVGTWHEEKQTDTDAQTHSLYLDFQARERIYQGTTRTYVAIDGGLGVAWVNYDGPFDDSLGAAAQVRGMLEWELSSSFGLHAGAAGFVWGYPGNFLGYGTYVFLGGELVF